MRQGLTQPMDPDGPVSRCQGAICGQKTEDMAKSLFSVAREQSHRPESAVAFGFAMQIRIRQVEIKDGSVLDHISSKCLSNLPSNPSSDQETHTTC